MRSRRVLRLETCRPGHHHGTRFAIQAGGYFHHHCCSLDVAPPWTFVWPPPSQRQLAEAQHRRHSIANSRLRQQGIHYRLLNWTADGRPHPTVTRTLQYAADNASSRNGQQMSAKSLHRRWKHEIQIALLRRRAAMARAVLPNPSLRAEWLLAGIIDRALHHWGHDPLLTVDPTTTTMPTPRLTQQYQTMTTTSPVSPVVRSSLCSHQVSNCWVPPHSGWFVSGWRWFLRLTSQMSLSPAALCHPLTLSSKTSSKITRCPGRLLAKCLHWRWRPVGAAFQRNGLSQHCREK